jgi:hypothetical protein
VSRVVHLHVGTAKSGTTWLQHVMAQNRRLLARHGYLYPGTRNSHFFASLSLRETGFKGHEYAAAEGEWERIAAEVRSFDGQALVSHETLANAKPAQIATAVGSFPDAEVRVVITCRDLGRQLPAAWQERVKNRNEQTYEDFLAAVRDGWNDGRPAPRATFWRGQQLVTLAERWAGAVGVDRVTLVTVPPPGAEPDELWRRFARAVDAPEVDMDLEVRTSNTSLGTVETELLRRLNGYLGEDVAWPRYERLVKHRLVKDELAPYELGGKFTLPEEERPWAEEIAGRMVEELRAAGYPVVGDLDDLRPTYRGTATHPRDVGDDQLLELALRVLSSTAMRPLESQSRPAPREAARILARAVRRRLRLG